MKALALLSGGLDSALAVRVIRDQGIEVLALHFYTGFCITERKRRMGVLDENDPRRFKNDALATARSIGVPIPTTAFVEQLFTALRVRGRGGLDHSGVITLFEDLAGVQVRRVDSAQ